MPARQPSVNEFRGPSPEETEEYIREKFEWVEWCKANRTDDDRAAEDAHNDRLMAEAQAQAKAEAETIARLSDHFDGPAVRTSEEEARINAAESAANSATSTLDIRSILEGGSHG